MKIMAGLLAAGTSSRMGKNKAFLPIDEKVLVDFSLSALQSIANEDVFIITGQHHKEFASKLPQRNLLFNSQYSSGMASSIVVAAQHAQDSSYDALLIHLADLPSVVDDDIRQILAEFSKNPKQVVASRRDPMDPSSLAPPCIFPRDFFPQLLSLTGDQGAKSLLEELRAQSLPLTFPWQDVDDESSYKAWVSSKIN
ncbi:MAG: nucleotidyltransferase family protein [Bdellovibrionales bacterium]|nr:nucleotidyltransferase family protein [Bdellovibrionales bacterium]